MSVKQFKIKINSIDKVKRFTTAVSKYESSLDIISGRYLIDAKSIMGIFSLDLTKTLTLNIRISDKTKNEYDNLVKDLKEFIVDE